MASLAANMINGISCLIVAYSSALRDDSFTERVGSVSAREIARTAKERRAGSLEYAEAILNIYNKRTKAGLSIGRLYDTGKRKGDYVEYITDESEDD